MQCTHLQYCIHVLTVSICELQTLVSSLFHTEGEIMETAVSLLMVTSFRIACHIHMTCGQQTYP